MAEILTETPATMPKAISKYSRKKTMIAPPPKEDPKEEPEEEKEEEQESNKEKDTVAKRGYFYFLLFLQISLFFAQLRLLFF